MSGSGGGWLRLTEYVHDRGLPELLLQWDTERNRTLSPEQANSGSDMKVWWKCDQGHSWQARINSRTLQGRGCPYCAGKKVIPGQTDLATQHPDLAAQWHPTKNGALHPVNVSPGSEKSVWWLCAQGHEWQCFVSLRAKRGQTCPYCAGQRVLPGENDLATRYPEVAVRWHPTLNAIPPSQVMPHTHKRYWWQCERGHEWQVAPTALIQGSGCPYCAGKRVIPGETDLEALHPKLAAQWHPTKNGALTPRKVGAGNMKRVWWLCERDHDYQAPVYSRVQGCGCPYCAGKRAWPGFNDVATLFPHLTAEWHPTLNGALTPRDVTKGSHKAVWWECRDGHVWKAAVFSRTRAKPTNCPICAGKAKMKKTV